MREDDLKYTPSPLDTSSERLPEELYPLTEQIAKQVHEVWARNRILQGWTYGPVRDDKLKQHPCLIPYESLTEDEKHFDRQTAFETLRFIRHMGFDVVPAQREEKTGESF